jgi:hypothetical protein
MESNPNPDQHGYDLAGHAHLVAGLQVHIQIQIKQNEKHLDLSPSHLEIAISYIVCLKKIKSSLCSWLINLLFNISSRRNVFGLEVVTNVENNKCKHRSRIKADRIGGHGNVMGWKYGLWGSKDVWLSGWYSFGTLSISHISIQI